MSEPASDLPPAPDRVEDPTEAQQAALARRAEAAAERALTARGYDDRLAPDRLSFVVSTNSARTRRVANITPVDATAVTPRFEVTLTWQYYAALSWEAFATAIRHEVVHAIEFTEHGSFTHGAQFRAYAEDFDTAARLSDLVSGVTEAIDHRYRLACLACDFAAVRDRASPVVKRPCERRCPDCGGGLRVRHNASGRTWEGVDGYRTVRRAVEATPDVDW